MAIPLCLILIPIAAGFVLLTWKLFYDRGERLLADWAVDNRLELIAAKRSRGLFFWAGPFFYISGQIVYRIEVKELFPANREPNLRSGWIRIGSFWPWFPVPAREFKVHWDLEGESSNA